MKPSEDQPSKATESREGIRCFISFLFDVAASFKSALVAILIKSDLWSLK